MIGRIKFGDLVLSIVKKYLIQCPFLGGSSLRGSTVPVECLFLGGSHVHKPVCVNREKVGKQNSGVLLEEAGRDSRTYGTVYHQQVYSDPIILDEVVLHLNELESKP